MIETVGGRLAAIHLRPWPKLVSLPELVPLGPRYHPAGTADRCLLYYNQPLADAELPGAQVHRLDRRHAATPRFARR